MRADLSSLLSGAPGHAELRTHSNRTISMQLLNGNMVENSRREVSGSSARVYKGGRWGFASVPELTNTALEKILAQAARNADLIGDSGGEALELGGASTSVEKDFSTKKSRLSQKELAEYLRELDEHVTKKYPALTGRRVFLTGLDMEKNVFTSSGAHSYSNVPRTHVMVSMTMERNGSPVELMESLGGLGHFEDLFSDPSVFYPRLSEMYENLAKKNQGIHAEAGTHDVILASDLAGILAHEAIGHTTEADNILGGSIASDFLNKEAASELVSLVDFAHTALGEQCPVPVYVDDEGTTAEDAVIIDRGILKGYMHNKESAAKLGMKALGNARGFLFHDEPLIRMRNTAILPGKSKLADMIKSIKSGYLLQNPGNGQADTSGEFMFLVRLGFEIKDGKLGRALQDTTISGKAFDMLKTVSMVSDEMRWESRGFCGKKQPMSVGMGGPALKCRVNVGGR